MMRTDDFTGNNCIRSMYEPIADKKQENNEGLVAIIKLKTLSEEYRKPEYQLFRLTGGFGCTPTSSGNACYGYFCKDGEETRWERQNFIGIANADAVKIAEQLESEWNGGNQSGNTLEKNDDAEMEM